MSIRILIDQGSQVSLITESLVKRLQLIRYPSSLAITGMGAGPSSITRGVVSLHISPHFESPLTVNLNAYILPTLTSALPSTTANTTAWSNLTISPLADPLFYKPGRIDVIAGADVYGQIIEGEVKRGLILGSIAQLTKFGWAISGPCQSFSFSGLVNTFQCRTDDDLQVQLERFWLQEEIAPTSAEQLSALDLACEEHFATTHSRTPSGRYIVRLPFKQSVSALGQSLPYAFQALHRLQHKFRADPGFGDTYTSFLTEYERLNHMIKIPATKDDPPNVFYLPHHGVVTNSSPTPKLRVVFNGSCPAKDGLSVNEILHTGPKLQNELSQVLLWMRQFRFVFSCDIEKMYRQICVHQDDWDFQRIRWAPDHSIQKYHLTTVTYGLACAPYLALRTIAQLIQDEGSSFPLAVEIMNKGRYVDDMFGGGDTVGHVHNQIHDLINLCKAGGFPLRKWIANQPDLLSLIPLDHQMGTSCHSIKPNFVPALGLLWDTGSDSFGYDIPSSISSEESWTKRKVLSTISKFFDPLGFLSPILISAKVFMQDLWSVQLHWDDTLPPSQLQKWLFILNQLQGVGSLTIPRWIGITSQSEIQIHGFCDASQKAMSAAVYVKVVNMNQIYLLCSKTKVAPLKRLTIPRLELSAAVMLAKLTASSIKTLGLISTPCFLWTDSSIVITWLTNDPSRWKDFGCNRVQVIRHHLPSAQWRHVAGVTNSADCATRGVSADELQSHPLWWHGPSWLLQDTVHWPIGVSVSDSSKCDLEERTKAVHVTALAPSSWDLLSRYSVLNKLTRVTATIFRAVELFRGRGSTLTVLFGIPLNNLFIKFNCMFE